MMLATVPISVHGATTPSSKGPSCPVTLVKRSGPDVSINASPLGRTTRSAKSGCVTAPRQRDVSMIAVPPAGQDTRRPGEELGADEPLQPTDVRNVASATTRNGERARFTIERQDSIDRGRRRVLAARASRRDGGICHRAPALFDDDHDLAVGAVLVHRLVSERELFEAPHSRALQSPGTLWLLLALDWGSMWLRRMVRFEGRPAPSICRLYENGQ